MKDIARRIASQVLAEQDRTALKITQMKALLDGFGSRGAMSFGIMGAYVPESKHQNQQSHGDLMADLGRHGYRARKMTLHSMWTDEAISQDYREKSLFIPGARPKDIFDLGRKYNQDAVIFKSSDGVMGMYYLRTNQVELAVKLDGSIAYELSTGQDLYSKDRGNSFSFGFLWGQRIPWDGHTALNHDDVQRLLDSGKIKPVS